MRNSEHDNPAPNLPVVTEAAKVVAQRRAHYGHPAPSMECTAALWTAYLRERFGLPQSLLPEDVALMMVAFKLSRAMRNLDQDERIAVDHLIDICGYADVAGACQE